MAKAKPGKVTRKSAEKSAATPVVEKIPQPHGGALLSGGMPGNVGGTGRPPDAWRALCRTLASRTEMVQTAEEVLKDKNHPAWLGAWKFLAEQGYGKAAQSLDLTTDGKPLVPQVIIIGGQRVVF